MSPWPMWITTEDDPGRVLRPRIEAAGGDASLVRFVKGEVVFPSGKVPFTDLVIRRASEAEGLALVILDPLFSTSMPRSGRSPTPRCVRA